MRYQAARTDSNDSKLLINTFRRKIGQTNIGTCKDVSRQVISTDGWNKSTANMIYSKTHTHNEVQLQRLPFRLMLKGYQCYQSSTKRYQQNMTRLKVWGLRQQRPHSFCAVWQQRVTWQHSQSIGQRRSIGWQACNPSR